MTHEIKAMEVWGGNYTTEESVRLPGLSGHVIARPSMGRLRGDIFLLTVCSVGVMAKILIVDTFNRGPELGLLSQEMRRLLATYGSEFDNSRLTASFSRGLSGMIDIKEEVRLTAATFDTRTGELIYTHRDAPDVIMRGKKDSHWFRLKGGGSSVRDIPLGNLKETGYRQSTVEISPGDWIIFFTSGLISLFETADGEDGLKAMLDRLDETRADDPETLAGDLVGPFTDRENAGSAPDRDMLLLVLKAMPGDFRR